MVLIVKIIQQILRFQHIQLNIYNEYSICKTIVTSTTGLLGDLRSVTLGLLSFDDLVAWLKEDAESMSRVVGLSLRTARGDTFWGTSEDPLLKSEYTNVNKWIPLWGMETHISQF